MFVILKSIVKKINAQTELYFVDKLHDYDNIINGKEKKIKELDDELKKMENVQVQNNDAVNKNNFEFDYNIIDLFNKTKYQDENILKLSKEIDDKFNFNYEAILKEFISAVNNNEKIYNFCVNLRSKFSSSLIYDLKTKDNYEIELKKILDDNELTIFNHFKLIYKDKSIDSFINYLEELIDLNNPNILVYVGDKRENYDNMSKYIKTRYTSSIYKGIKIVYKDKMYDFSLSERNV